MGWTAWAGAMSCMRSPLGRHTTNIETDFPAKGLTCTKKLREALGAKSGEDTFDVVLNRFDDGTISPWVSLPEWLNEHDIQFTEAEKWDEN